MTATLIIDPAFLGDVVFNGPLVAAVRALDADARVGIVVRPPSQAIADRIVGVDSVHIYDKYGKDAGWVGLRRIARELSEAKYDRALIPHGSLRSALLAWQARIPIRIGGSKNPIARALYTGRVSSLPRGHVASRVALLGSNLSVDLGKTIAAGSEPDVHDRPRVGLSLGAHWQTKRWPKGHGLAFVELLESHDVEVVCLGAEWERDLYEGITFGPRVVDAIGGSVDALISAIAGCDVVVAGDTGPLHIARALGIPVVALFGPTDERLHDFSPRDAVLSVAVDCRPCSAHGDRACPEGHHRCLEDLAPERVVGSVVDALREWP